MTPGVLEQILCGLPTITDPKLIAGTENSDDAGVYLLDEETALIQTVDFFTPIVDDPFQFGRITAANALSDVYAMGGRPLLVMNLVAFPVKDMDAAVLKEIIRGGLEKIHEAGAVLVGGHSIEDKELKYGLSVTGIAHPDKIVLNSGARPGDKLLLTKPLGTGILSTAVKGGLADEKTEAEIASLMATLNKRAAELMIETEVHACTDITGFGLIGHLFEMSYASGVSVNLFTEEIPVMPGVVDFVNMGIIPEGAYNNQKFYRHKIPSLAARKDPKDIILYDPQTSGGLLLAAPEKELDTIISGLSASGYQYEVVVVGEIENGTAGSIVIL